MTATLDSPRSSARLVAAPKRTAKALFRSYGILTSPLRRMPDFLIIGAKRCGTTSLYRHLIAHPQIAPLFPSIEHRKGVHYFDRNANRSVAWYRSHFAIRRAFGGPALCGEASPYYLHHPYAPQRAAAVAPRAKLIVLLRDPVARAWSHYCDEVKNGREPLPFREAIAAEAERAAVEYERLQREPAYASRPYEHLTYVTQGMYAQHLRRWLDVYPRQQVLAVRSEDLFADPAKALESVCSFLGLEDDGPGTFHHLNASPPLPTDIEMMDELREQYRQPNAELADVLGGWPGW